MLQLKDQYQHPFSFSQEDVNNFAEVTGDRNPIHLDEAFAAKTMFKKRIVHGMLSSTIFSKVLGTAFPGEGTIYLSQNLEFKRPMFPGEQYLALFEVVELHGKNRATLSTLIKHQESGKTTVEGKAVLMHPDLLPA